jgi:proteasome assembly chaperone (PAC2) family protein
MINCQSLPELRAPVVLCALSGWSDGAMASTTALNFLVSKWETERFAEVDGESIYVYTTTRPTSILLRPGERALRWPELAFHALRLPHAERDVVVLVGPEPDLRWRACAQAVVRLAERLNASQIVTLGCFLATVSHRGAVPLIGLSADGDLRRRLEMLGTNETDYQGPTAFTTALVSAAAEAGLPAASIWAAAPAYLQGGSNPKIASALLRAVEGLVATDLAMAELDTAGKDLEQRVDEALSSRPDLQQFVTGLSGGSSTSRTPEPESDPEPPAAEQAELPSPKEFLAEMEEFLRGLRRQGPGQGESQGRA